MEEKRLCCAFTGHRPAKLPENGDEKSNQIMACKHFLFMEIHRALQEGYREFLCGMAMGTDLWCGEILLACRRLYPDAVLHAVLPWRTQSRGWPAQWQERYRAVLSQAQKVTVLAEEYDPGCYSRRNLFLAEHSSRLIALCNGHSGGSGETVRMAKRLGCEIILQDPSCPVQLRL